MHTLRRPAALLAVLVAAVMAFALLGCSTPKGSEPAGQSTSQTPPPAATNESPGEQSGAAPENPAEQQGAEQQPAPGEEPLHVSTVKPAGDEVAVVKTNKGEIRFKLFAKDAPNTVASFIELANKKFYDGTRWHRVVPGFVIQGGDPLSKTLPAGDPRIGTGGPGYRLKAEFNARKHLTGTVAMARSQDPDSAGSQFYICLAPQPSLDGQYTVFGQVSSGMDVVAKIQADDVIQSVRIVHGK
jgi:peptidyl-prolyl cis-trans isomerase B (cyclophilin B)